MGLDGVDTGAMKKLSKKVLKILAVILGDVSHEDPVTLYHWLKQCLTRPKVGPKDQIQDFLWDQMSKLSNYRTRPNPRSVKVSRQRHHIVCSIAPLCHRDIMSL